MLPSQVSWWNTHLKAACKEFQSGVKFSAIIQTLKSCKTLQTDLTLLEKEQWRKWMTKRLQVTFIYIELYTIQIQHPAFIWGVFFLASLISKYHSVCLNVLVIPYHTWSSPRTSDNCHLEKHHCTSSSTYQSPLCKRPWSQQLHPCKQIHEKNQLFSKTVWLF